MKKLTMYRKQLPECSPGVLMAGDIELQSIERPWITSSSWPSGKPNVSCVPYGTYELVPHSGTKFEDTVALVNHELGVYHFRESCKLSSDRYQILIHVGNWAEDGEGCVMLGTSTAVRSKTKQPGVGHSRDAMKIFKRFIKDYTRIEIKPERRERKDRRRK